MNSRIDRLAKEINALKAQVNNQNSPQLAYSSIEDGSINEYDENGNLVSIIGRQIDGTHGHNVVSGPTPPAPADAGIEVEGGSGVFKIRWNGTFEGDDVAPLDFARVEIHVSETSGFDFEPLPDSPTRAGSIESAGGGEVVMVRVAGTYYIRLVTRATTGKFSTPSAEFSVVVDPVVSAEELEGIMQEIADANLSLDELQITLGTVQTDLDEAQAVLDTIDTIDSRLGNLEAENLSLAADVANASQAATNAQTTAAAAESVAGAAQAAATAAATAASNAAAEAGAATQAAQEAEAQALQAANLVAGKSTVYYGSTAPAGDPNGLWIKDGKPYLWNGTEWVEQENPELVQAVADAAQAKTNAVNALSLANQAKTDAANAQAAAAQAAADAGTAQTAAQNALNAAQSAETAANAAALSSDDAAQASQAASAAAGAAQLTASNASTVANEASTKATNALSDAQNAASNAATAVQTANSATTAAQAAQNAADAANAEALAAAGLAGSKGEVIYQASAPTGSRATSQNLWIRTSDNKPHTYNGSTWVAVTDKAATDAAAAAASAATAAASANNQLTLWRAPNSTLIDGGKIFTDSITANQIASGAITADEIAANAVTAAKINAGAVIAGKIAANAVTAGTIAANAVAAGTVAADAITGREIKALSIDTSHLRADAITSDKIAARAITADKLVISSTHNMVPNGALEFGDLTGWNSNLLLSTDAPTGHKHSVRVDPAVGGGTTPVTFFDVNPDNQYLFEVWLKADRPNSRIYIEFRDQDGNHAFSSEAIAGENHAGNSTYPVSNQLVPTTWTRYRGILTPRGQVQKARLATVYWNHANGTERNAVQYVAGMRIVPMTPSVTIQDGIITADKLATNSVTASKIVGLTITGDKIAANAISADKITANAITTDKIAANAVTAAEIKALSITTDKLAANAITAEKIRAGAITVGKLAAGTLSASNIEAGYINSDIGIGTSGSLTVGNTSGKHVLIGDGAITSLVPGATGLIPTITIGTSADAFRLVDSNGAYIGGIQADASVRTPELDADVIRLDGNDLAEQISSLPQGQLMYANEYTTTVGPYTGKTGVYEFPVDVVGGRTYIIHTAFRGRQRGSRYLQYGMNYTFSTGSPTAPRINSTQLSSIRIKDIPNNADSIFADIPDWFVYEPSQSGTARFLFWIDTGDVGSDGVEGRSFRFLVTDAGLASDNVGRPSLGGASGTTPVEPPPLKKYVKEYYFDNHEVWTQYGRGDTYAPQWVRSGNHSSFSSRYRTYLVLPSAARSALAGASSVSKIEIRLSQTSGFAGRPWMGTILTTNITTSEPTIYDAAQSGTSYNTGQTKWMTLSTAQRNRLAGSGVGIVVGRTSAVTNQDFYGSGASTSVRPKVRITYYA